MCVWYVCGEVFERKCILHKWNWDLLERKKNGTWAGPGPALRCFLLNNHLAFTSVFHRLFAASFQPLPSPSNNSFERTTSGRKSSCPEEWKGPNVNTCRPQSFTTALSHFSSQRTEPRRKSSKSYQWGWTPVSFRLVSFGLSKFSLLEGGSLRVYADGRKGNRTQLGPRFQISPRKHDFCLNA